MKKTNAAIAVGVAGAIGLLVAAGVGAFDSPPGKPDILVAAQSHLLGDSIAWALFSSGAWNGLAASSCIDARVACNLADDEVSDGGRILAPSEEVVTIRGSGAPAGVPEAPGCRVVRLSDAYSCGVQPQLVRRYPGASQPTTREGCACSNGNPTCEVSDDNGATWRSAPKGPNVYQPSRWRGNCVAAQCSVSAELISGVGADNSLDYAAPVQCGGPGKKPPVGPPANVPTKDLPLR